MSKPQENTEKFNAQLPVADPFSLLINPDVVLKAVRALKKTDAIPGRVYRPLDAVRQVPRMREPQSDPIGYWYRQGPVGSSNPLSISQQDQDMRVDEESAAQTKQSIGLQDLKGPFSRAVLPGGNFLSVHVVAKEFRREMDRTGLNLAKVHRSLDPVIQEDLPYQQFVTLVRPRFNSRNLVHRSLVKGIFNVFAQIPGLKMPVVSYEDTSLQRFNGEQVLYVDAQIAARQVEECQKKDRILWEDIFRRAGQKGLDADALRGIEVICTHLGPNSRVVAREPIKNIMSLYKPE